MGNKKELRLTFNVDEEFKNKLSIQADKENRTVSSLIRNVLIKYLDENQSK